MEICNICKKEYTNMGVHLRQAHKMSIEDYRKEYPTEEVDEQDEFSDIEDTKESVVLVEKEEEEKKEEEEIPPTELLSDFLDENKLSKKELIAIIENYKTGKNIPAKMIEKRDNQIGEDGAGQFKDKNYAETRNLHIAETLVKQYGFKVVEVTTKGHTIPKTWILKKI